ncbi:potassium channel subfamily K member 2-like isoform X1 [Branchiostoma floridae x Branchiostoma belcheri]
MNWKALLGLAISYVAVLLVGAAVFKVLEEAFSPPVNETIGLPRRSDLEGVLQNFSDHQNLSISLQELLGLIDAADEVRSVNVKYAESVNTTAQLYIDFFDSLFFCGTIITTIGYGHITPQTDPGKLFCIAYALIGIPITFFLLAAIGIKIGDANRWGEKKIKRALKVLERWPGVLRSCTIFLITVTGFGIFFFAPAYLFMIVEGWTYLHSIYYVFITLSTIGFGDMVTTLQDIENIYYDYAYKIAVIIWIMIGLSFLATIIDLISDAMKQMQQQMQENLKNVATGVSLDKFGNSLAGSVKGLGTPQMLKRKGKGKKGKAESAPDISTGCYDTLEKERGMAWGPDRETIL